MIRILYFIDEKQWEPFFRSVQLSCAAIGNPKPTIKWRRSDGKRMKFRGRNGGVHQSEYTKYQNHVYLITVYLILLHTPSFLLVIRVIIKISKNPYCSINVDWFSLQWSEKKKNFFGKKNSKWQHKKNLIFQLRQFSIFVHENFMDWSLG